jgi:hypothetical protein
LAGSIRTEVDREVPRKEANVLETYALYSTELTDDERELGFELLEIQNLDSQFSNRSTRVHAVAYRFSESDQIVKMNIPVIGGHSFRHERRNAASTEGEAWVPAGVVVFPTAEQALDSVAGIASKQMELCR